MKHLESIRALEAARERLRLLEHNKLRFVRRMTVDPPRELAALAAMRDLVLELLAWHVEEYKSRPGEGLRVDDRSVRWSNRTLNEKAVFDDASRLLGLPESNDQGVPQELRR